MTTKNIYNNLISQLDRLHRHNRQGSFKTRERYYTMQRFCAFLAERYRLERIANIAPKHIQAYAKFMQLKNLSASTIKTDLAAIRFWHDQIPRPRHALPGNDILDLARRSFGNVDRSWSTPEVHKMMGVCAEHGHEDYLAAVCLARYAGLADSRVLPY
jgi:hypothetical protein